MDVDQLYDLIDSYSDDELQCLRAKYEAVGKRDKLDVVEQELFLRGYDVYETECIDAFHLKGDC